MAENKNFGSRLEAMKASNPDLYESIIRWYGPADLQKLENDESVFNAFAAQFDAENKNRIEADEALETAINEEVANVEDDGVAADEEVAASGSEEAAASSETLAAVSDPFHWETFYAPAPEVETARFDQAYSLLNSEEGKGFQESPAWKSSTIEFDNSEDKSLEETLNLSACRRLASSNEDITLESLSSARAEESARIKVEYYNSLYALAVGDKYNSIKAETHLNRIFKIDEAVRTGKSEKEIFKMLAINPNEATQKMAQTTVARANMQPVSDFVDSRKKFSRGMHNLGKVMDRIQKFEQKNPLFGVGLNFVAAGNPVYMGYRSILSARALYNDFQGFKDYAAFREVYKNDVAELGLKRWNEQNPESKVDANDYNQVKAYDTYEAYCEKHSVEANRVSEEEFLQLKKFQKKAVFTREEFESLRQATGMPYEEYAQKAGDRAVSKEMFDNLVKYTDIRRTQNYAEYAKNVGDRAVSEAEYNQVKTLNRALGKVSIKQVVKDKTTRDAMMAHSVIFVRSLPVVGQGYALFMASKNMVRKSYWQGVKAKAQGTGHALKALWKSKGRDKEAWKELYSNGGGLMAEAFGAYMLSSGVSNMLGGEVVAEPQNGNINMNTAGNNQQVASNLQNVEMTDTLQMATRTDTLQNVEMTDTLQMAVKTDTLQNVGQADTLQMAVKTDTLQNVEMTDSLQMAVKTDTLQNVGQTDTLQMENIFQQNWKYPDFVNAADSAEIQVPYAPGEHESDARTGDDQVFFKAKETAVELNDAQKANLNALFVQYPRAASIILEGNDNPAVDDVTKGTFTLEGEGNLYKSGVISSAQLQEMMAEGKFTSAQLESLSRFADANFENGKMNAELAGQLYGSNEDTQSSEQNTDENNEQKKGGNEQEVHGGNEQNQESAIRFYSLLVEQLYGSNEDTQSSEQNTDENNEQKKGENEQKVHGGNEQNQESAIRFYSFDKDGNIIYNAESLQDLDGLNPDQMDARAYQDLLARQANGEQLDAGALKFLESYEKSHPDIQQMEGNLGEKQKTENNEADATAPTVLSDREQAEQLSGITLTHHAFESGKGYELSGSGEINGKQVDVVNLFDENDTQLVSQYTIHEGEDRSTVIKTQLGDDGRPYTLVTEIEGDQTTTREVESAQKVLREALAGEEKQIGQETKGLEESRNLANNDENGEEKEVQTQTDKVRSSTFRGKYWLETEANGENPQLRCRMGDPSQIAVDREMVAAFQNTIGGSGSNYTALGGLLTADNYGAENRDNPNASGIMIKCENLAKTIALNEAVYQDMEHRLEKGEELSKLEMKWRQNYEQDLKNIGLSRENGRLVYEPEHASPRTTNQQQEEVKGNDQEDSRRVYQLDESRNTDGLLHASEVNGYTQLEGKGVKLAYSLTDDGQVKYAGNATVTVDKSVLQAVRSQYGSSLTPVEAGNSLAMARDITKGEVIYGYLQQESGNRELTDAENSFMQNHNQTLAKAGLVRDNGGEIVKKDAYEGQPRALIKRGREYDC